MVNYRDESVYTVMKALDERDEYVLPAMQREFVWDEDRIYDLLDSITRSYPFGSLLFWETKPDRFRTFQNEYSDDELTEYRLEKNERGERKTFVLDGQQRVQSLYISLYGRFNKKKLYFDVLSNPERGVSDRRYEFKFLSDERVEERNKGIEKFELENIDDFDYFVPFSKIIHTSKDASIKREIRKGLKEKIKNWSDEVEELIEDNINTVRSRFRTERNLSFFEITETEIEDLDMDDILEIFDRINTRGTELEKADLMFSIVAQYMEMDAWSKFTHLLRELRRKYGGYRFEEGSINGKDFIVKTFLVVEGLGARYEADKIRDRKVIKDLEEKFDSIADAIKKCMDFVIEDAKIKCYGILGSYLSLIPLIYWVYKQKGDKIIPPSEKDRIKHFIYLSRYTKATSRYADGRINQLIDKWGKIDESFPLEDSLEFMRDKEGSIKINEELLNQNKDLTLNIIHNGIELEPGYEKNKPERDHIFPKSLLKMKDYPEDKINHFANYWFIPQGRNRNKYNKPPLKHFKKEFDVDGSELKSRLKKEKVLPPNGTLNDLKLDNFEQFLGDRKQMISRKVKKFLEY